jgi:hypothetical protein
MVQPLLWFVLGAVHFLPALALVRPDLISRLYGIAPADPAFLLVQHRAGLFACVVAVCIWAMFDPAVRRLGVGVVGISMVSFLALYSLHQSPASLKSIALIDLGALPVLVASAYLAWKS